MPKVNVVLWDGSVASVDSEVAKKLSPQYGQREDVTAAAARTRQEYNEENTSAIRAGVEGAADALTFGGYGKVSSFVAGEEHEQRMQATAQSHPGARLAGELSTALLPTGLLGQTGKVASEATAFGIAARAGKAVGGNTGRFVEGGLLGLGGSIAHSNVTGDSLTVEAALEGVTVGGLLNLGLGVLGGKLQKKSAQAQAEVKAAEELEGHATRAAKGEQVFDGDYPSFTEMGEARKAAKKSTDSLNREIQKEHDRFRSFVGEKTTGKQFVNATRGVDAAIQEVRNRYRPVSAASSAEEALAAAQGEVGGALGELGAEAADAGRASVKREAVGYSRGARLPDGTNATVSSKVDVDRRPPISPEIEAKLKRWSQERSEISKLNTGGKKAGRDRWEKDAAAARNPDEAMRRLHALRDEIAGPNGFPDASRLIPELPPMPRPLVERVTGELPKDLETLSRMHAESVNQIGQTLTKEEAGALGRLLDDLGLEKTGNPAQDFAGLHRSLQEYKTSMARVEELAIKEQSTKPGFFGRWLNHTGRLAGARAGRSVGGGGIVGGAIGWASGNALGGALMGSLGGVLVNGKAAIRGQIRDLFANYGTQAGKAVTKLGPVTSILRTSFPSGSLDTETNTRTLAKKRIEELHNARGAAPDLAFTAIEPLLEAPGDIAYKLHSRVTGILNHLADTAPQDPGLTMNGFTSRWDPAAHDVMALAHRMEAAFYPMRALARMIDGQAHPAAVETMWAFYPGVMVAATEELANNADAIDKKPLSQKNALSKVFYTPLSGLASPEAVTALQSMYLPGSPGGQQLTPEGIDSPNPTGRPPATGRTALAGSNVTMNQRLQAG